MNAEPEVPRDRHADRNVALLLGLLILLLALLLGPWFIHHWVDRAGASDIQDPGSLPWRIAACGREWERGEVFVTTTLDGARARSGVEPIVVDIAPFAPCPDGRCARSGHDTLCATAVFVRVGEADYVGFDLLGGP